MSIAHDILDALPFSFQRYDKVFLAFKWGLIWGPVQGFWFLAGHFLTSHVLYPVSVWDWACVLLFLLGAFSIIGLACSVFALLPLLVLEKIWKPFSTRSGATCGIAIGMVFPFTYLFLGYLAVWAKLGSIPPLTDALAVADIIALIGFIAVLSASLVVAAKRSLLSLHRSSRLLIGCAIVGALILPGRLVDLRSRTAVADSVRLESISSPAGKQRTPLLFIGIDGANWTTIAPLLGSDLPTLNRLMTHGVHGTMEGLWPPYLSGPAWAAILTGFPRDQTGVYEDLMVSASLLGTPFQLPLMPDIKIIPLLLLEHYLARLGLITIKPQSRFMLRRTPIWDYLSKGPKKLKVAVVRFWFTYPVSSDPWPIVVSDWVGKDAWSSLHVDNRAATRLVAPEWMSGKLLEFFAERPGDSGHVLGDFLDLRDYRQPPDTAQDPAEMLRSSWRIDSHTLAATTHILQQNPDLDCLMVYLGGFDMVSHAFWQYRFPEQFNSMPPAREDIDHLGSVIDRYLKFLDQQLDALISRFPTSPNILLVSDHGHEANHSPLIWRSQHAPGGIFLAAGPDISAAKAPISVSYYDIVPTILQLLNFRQPKGLSGKSVLATDLASGESR